MARSKLLWVLFMNIALTISGRGHERWSFPRMELSSLTDEEIVDLLYTDPELFRKLAKEGSDVGAGRSPATNYPLDAPDDNFIPTEFDDGKQAKSFIRVQHFGPRKSLTKKLRQEGYGHLILHN